MKRLTVVMSVIAVIVLVAGTALAAGPAENFAIINQGKPGTGVKCIEHGLAIEFPGARIAVTGDWTSPGPADVVIVPQRFTETSHLGIPWNKSVKALVTFHGHGHEVIAGSCSRFAHKVKQLL